MNEPLQNGLEKALRRLREDTATAGAPDVLEQNLLGAFRAHHAVQRRRGVSMWAPAALAASLLVGAFSWKSEPVKVDAPVVPSVRMAAQQETGIAPAPSEVTTAPVKKRRSPVKRRVRPAPAASGERLLLASSRPAPERQEFIEIPYAPPFMPYDQGQVMRVNMAGSSARRMGIPVMTDRVQADLLVGNDGLPRAIRLVSNSGAQYQ